MLTRGKGWKLWKSFIIEQSKQEKIDEKDQKGMVRRLKSVVKRVPLSVEWLRDFWRWWNRSYYRTKRSESVVKKRDDHSVEISTQSFDEIECIFIHIPKAAGTSICDALFGARVGHKDAHRYRMIFGRDFWSYFKFTIVRNPFSRVVSAYEYLKHGGHPAFPEDKHYQEEVLKHYDGFSEFVTEELERAANEQIHFRPQVDFLTVDGKLAVDYVGRMETLQEDFQTICRHLGVDATLPHKNKTPDNQNRLTDYYEKHNVLSTVKKVYADDFSEFDYRTQL